MWSRLRTWWADRRNRSEQTKSGAEGERLAADFLQKERGYAIVSRNWRDPHDRRDEIDLICRAGDALVFVEVKTRSAAALVSGYHAVGKKKKRVLLRVCTAYLRALGAKARPATIRFDVVEVSREPAASGTAGVEIRHFENVPLFRKDFWP